jgi:hypothetical protein
MAECFAQRMNGWMHERKSIRQRPFTPAKFFSQDGVLNVFSGARTLSLAGFEDR